VSSSSSLLPFSGQTKRHKMTMTFDPASKFKLL
jgi:hypothetical protein